MTSAAEATTIPLNVAAHRVPTDRLRMAVSGEPGTLVGQAQHSEHIVDGQIGTTDLATNAVFRGRRATDATPGDGAEAGETAVEDGDEADLEDEDVEEVAAAAR